MKLRLKGNTLRCRLQRSEVALLLEEGRVEERTALANGSFGYALVAGEFPALDARLEGLSIEVRIPRAEVVAWEAAGDVSLSGEVATPEGKLDVLIEKDFRCLHGRAEDESDSYPNPAA
jgi:hypothetical protein